MRDRYTKVKLRDDCSLQHDRRYAGCWGCILMYEEIDVAALRSSSPPLANALTELPRTLMDMQALMATLPLLSLTRRGDGHAVLVLPGFLAGDESTAVLRRFLRRRGYAPEPWALGRNTGRPDIIQTRLPERFLEFAQRCGQKISIIGQSLGGVYAREIGRMFPEQVRQVITLGSPFATRHGTSTVPIVRRLFEQQSGMTVEAMRALIDSMDPHVSPPVPLTAIYSRGDGVVNWRVCREHEEDHITENIEVCGSHCGMAFNPLIYRIVADRLAQPEDDWQPMGRRLRRRS